MSADQAKAFYDHAAKNKAVREELGNLFKNIQAIGKKHGFEFTLAEYYDCLHERTGMTSVGKSDSRPSTDIVTITICA